jgi:hypothetical protein
MDFSNPGVLFTGEMKGGANSSAATFKVPGVESKTTETQGYTQGNLIIQARPTKDTRAEVHFRVHQDWQKAHEEGISPILFDWFSYSGKFLDGHGNFALGDMRVKYSPLTLSTPTIDLLQEPTIMKARRQEAMSYRNLDGSDSRLLQGVNFKAWSGAFSVLDDLSFQATLARLRNQAKKAAQTFIDFDETDRFFLGSRAGASLFGLDVYANFAYSFNRDRSALNYFTPLLGTDSMQLEDNMVISGQMKYDLSKSLLSGLPVKIALLGEYAQSSYQSKYLIRQKELDTTQVPDSLTTVVGGEEKIYHYLINYVTVKKTDVGFVEEPKLNGSAMNIGMEAKIANEMADGSLTVTYLSNNEKFQSDLAMSPVYITPGAILNAKGLDQIVGYQGAALLQQLRGTYESMYFSIYNSEPLTQQTLASSGSDPMPANQLLNNYKEVHTYRNAFTSTPMTRSEMLERYEIDPGVNLALPFGLASPNRKGVIVSADVLLLNDALEVNARFNSLGAVEGEGSVTTIGAGLAADFGKILSLGRLIKINAGFEQGSESKGFERKTQRISAGADLDVWGKLGFLAGFQTMSKEFPGTVELKTKEMLLLAGPEYKISTGSKVVAQWGMLNQSVETGGVKTEVNRQILMSEVQVKF